MKEKEAIELQKQLEAICKKHGLWFNKEQNHKPEPRMIRMEIFIKIDN